MRRIATFSAALCLLASLAHAQSQRTFVASTGSDANPCSRSLPCRNFAAAIAATASGGEVIVLDSAGYGAVTIGQSVSIIAPAGVYAGITGFTGSAVTVNAPAGVVVLRGLTINGLGATNGIECAVADSLYVESCTVSRFPNYGIYAYAPGNVFINDTAARENSVGASVYWFSGVVAGSVDHCRFEHNSSVGLSVVGSGARATVRDSVGANNETAFEVDTGQLQLKNCSIANNNWGLYATSGAIASVAASILSNNTYALYNNTSSATMWTFGDNDFIQNGADIAGSTGTLLRK